ncbi:S49 family peptidase [Rheinheimera sp. MMS21-TC3]|uniref:S49 family peptidase n=1 Tax=Rheinheimera sp. MMS21-TC3 TaxID=3072790 RepID=UPI0028C421CB|nr:S49 family peptidase [Rheinheimera sp. MMS21-TC3]WNO60883.1 S49 family peptidase [Rheinheimera sp. MMS21-TC3]
MSNYQMIAAAALNKPLAMDVGYARVFFSALGLRLGAESLVDAQGQELTRDGMTVVAESYVHPVTGQYRHYDIQDGIAVLSIHGALAHKTGNVRPKSGLQGYDGIQTMLNQALIDPDVKGIYLDMHTPGGTVFGAFDTADVIRRANAVKPVWAIANDMNCSAGQLLASAASRRLVTQTGTVGSIGVVVAHADYEKYLENEGVKITLLHSGSHKVDGNSYQALPKDVAARWQAEIDSTRMQFASKVAEYTNLSLQAVLDTEAATYNGQAAVDVGLAEQLVNSADGVAMMADHCRNLNRTMSIGNNTMSVAKPAAAAATKPAASAATEQTTEQTAAVVTATEAVASAELVVTLCAEAGMSDQIAPLITAKLTEAGVKTRLATLGGVRDALAAADLSAIFPEVSANIDDPAAMLKVVLTAATAHGDDKEVTSSKQVQTQASSVKQPDHKSAYNDPSRL